MKLKTFNHISLLKMTIIIEKFYKSFQIGFNLSMLIHLNYQ
jgi:hypothetical protein